MVGNVGVMVGVVSRMMCVVGMLRCTRCLMMYLMSDGGWCMSDAR